MSGITNSSLIHVLNCASQLLQLKRNSELKSSTQFPTRDSQRGVPHRSWECIWRPINLNFSADGKEGEELG